MRYILSALIFYWAYFGISIAQAAINVNEASADEIALSINGIGPVKAQAIKVYCAQNTCAKPDDLLNVKGIGPKNLMKIAPYIEFDSQESNS